MQVYGIDILQAMSNIFTKEIDKLCDFVKMSRRIPEVEC